MKKATFRVSPWIIVAMMTFLMLLITITVKAESEYSSAQGSAEVYPSMQGIDISEDDYSITSVMKTIDDSTSAAVCKVSADDLRFIQEWDIQSDKYPLDVTFYVPGTQNLTLYIISDSENGWSRVNRYQGSSMTVTFTDNTHAAVYVGPSLLTQFRIEPLQILKGTNGYMSSRWNSETQEEEEFFYYDPWRWRYDLKVTAVYDGVAYSGNVSNVEWNLENVVGRHVSIDFYDNQWSNPWECGQTYPVTASLMGMNTTFDVSIKEIPLEYIRVDDQTITEGTYCHLGWNEEKTDYKVIYNPYDFVNITIKYDGKEYEGSYNYIRQTLYQLTGSDYIPDITTDQSYETPWMPGETHQCKLSLLGKECTFDVTLKKSPFVSMQAEDANVIKDVDVFRFVFGNVKYTYIPEVTMTTESGEIVSGVERVAYTQDDLKVLYYKEEPFNVHIIDDQDTNVWDLGTHQATIYCGGLEKTINVTVVETPVADFTVDNILIYEKVGFPIDSVIRVPYTVTFKDGTSQSIDRQRLTYNGKNYSLQYDNSAASEWTAGNTYNMEFSILGYSKEIPVTVYGIESIEIEEENGLTLLIHQTNGDTVQAKVQNFYVMAASAGVDKFGSLRTDKGVFNATVYNYHDPNYQNIQIEIGGKKSNVLSSSKWIETNQYAMGRWFIGLARDNSFDGTVNQNNIDDILYTTFLYHARYHSSEGWDSNTMVYDAGFVKAEVAKVFAVNSEVDVSLSSYYRAENNTIVFPENRDYSSFDCEVISTETEQGFISYSYYGPEKDMKVLFDEEYKIKQYGPLNDAPQPHEHTWGEWEVVTEPTTTSEGLRKRVCSGCGEEETEVIPKVSRIQALTVQDVSIIEETCGVMRTQGDPNIGEAASYFEYMVGECLNLDIDITIDGERYIGTYYELCQEIPELVFDATGPDLQHPWEVGGTYDVVLTAILLDDESSASCPIKVTIIENPLSELTVNNLEIVEKTGGRYRPVPGSDDEMFYYYYPLSGASLSVKYDGKLYSGNLETVNDEIWEASEHEIAIQYLMVTSYVQDADHRWTVGNEYPVTVKLGKLSDTFTVSIVPEAHNHTWGEWEVVTPAGCTTEGLKRRTCSGCEEVEEEKVAALGHTWNKENTIDKEATCTAEGQKSIHCSVCGEIKEGSVEAIPKKAHTYGEWVITKEPTCTEAGSKERICSVCSDKETETIAAAHKWNTEYTIDKPATRTEEGSKSIHCSVCGEIKEGSQQVIPKVKLNPGWYKEDGIWYYVNNEGEFVKGWVKPGSVWYYMDPETGAMATGLIKVGNAFYYMEESGAMKSNCWINVDGTWYYAQGSGALKSGWIQSGSTWYYMDPDTCAMVTGWVKVSGSWYYMKESGAMATGWVKSGNDWYYMSASGVMVTGWVKVGESWYYMKSSGAMAANEWCSGYWLNANGTWTYQPRGSWKSNSTGWWFGDTSGWYAKNETIKIDGVSYTFDAKGYWVEEETAVENR